jgi:hypothetical protein
MKIVRFFAENVKRIKAVEVVPKKDASMVVIGGENDAGKSSLLDAIEMALGGARRHPAEPLRRGTKHGRVVIDLGDIVVHRSFGQGGSTQLVVESKAGKKFASPQAMLDKLYGDLTFDPLEFERQDGKAQAEVLRRLVGLDFSDLDKIREGLYENRKLENKTLDMLQSSLAGMVQHDDAPELEISVESISAELKAAEAFVAAADDASRKESDCRAVYSAAAAALRSAEEDVARLERQLEAARGRLAEVQTIIDDADTRLTAARDAQEAAKAAVPDTAPLHARLKEAEGLNVLWRENRSYLAQECAIRDQRSACDDLTHQIEAVDEEKGRRLAAAKYPVDGLSMSEAGDVLFNGIPFEQASTSDRIRVSVAMGLALHPKLKVLLVRDGSLLGEKKLKLIEEMVKAEGAQLWLEMMSETDSDKLTVYIEDGMIKPRAAEHESS